jgi:hypothetical protein
MARTAAITPQPVIDDLVRDFLIEDDREIMQFLDRDPYLPSLFREIRGAIRRFFGGEQVSLKVFHDPEWAGNDPGLYVNIQTLLDPQAALERLDAFDSHLWLKRLAETNAPVVVSLNLI